MEITATEKVHPFFKLINHACFTCKIFLITYSVWSSCIKHLIILQPSNTVLLLLFFEIGIYITYVLFRHLDDKLQMQLMKVKYSEKISFILCQFSNLFTQYKLVS